MKYLHIFFLLSAFLLNNTIATELPENIIYCNPLPNAVYVSPSTNVLIRFSDNFNKTITTNDIGVSLFGDKSRQQNLKIIQVEKTFHCQLMHNLEENETVEVVIKNTVINDTLFTYTFRTGEYPLPLKNDEWFGQNIQQNDDAYEYESDGTIRVLNGVSIPSNFPKFNITYSDNSAIGKGKLFMNNRSGPPYIMILNNDGSPYFYKQTTMRAIDFKLQANGLLTKRHLIDDFDGFVGLDSNYTIVDTFLCRNGYGTDGHEMYMLENGHYFLIATGMRNVDMSKLVSHGKANAQVIDNNIQEFDANKNLVFEWRSADHYTITDATHINLRNDIIDYVHMNSIAIDYDGHIIVSSRNLSEVTKIHRESGKIIWRFGGLKNQFSLVNDDPGISYQHHASPVKGKPNHYLIFDNGNFHLEKISRAVEFKIDTENKTAINVWEYVHPKKYYTSWMGSAQRLPNGNTLINWAVRDLPKLTEVNQQGEIVQIGDYAFETECYRIFRNEWINIADTPYLIAEPHPDKVALVFNKFGDTDVPAFVIYQGKDSLNLSPIDTTDVPYYYIYDLHDDERYYFGVTALDNNGNQSEMSNIDGVITHFVQKGNNIIRNGKFFDGLQYWDFSLVAGAEATVTLIDGEIHLEVDKNHKTPEQVQFSQNHLPLFKDHTYLLEFDTYSLHEALFQVKILGSTGSDEEYLKTSALYINNNDYHFKQTFTMGQPTDFLSKLVFNLGKYKGDLFLDNIRLVDITVTDVEDITTDEAISTFRLFENYPNPFNPSTTISYQVPERSHVSISVYNIVGEKITTVLSTEQQKGTHSVVFNAEGMPSGVYIYRIEAKSMDSDCYNNDARKMLLIK